MKPVASYNPNGTIGFRWEKKASGNLEEKKARVLKPNFGLTLIDEKTVVR